MARATAISRDSAARCSLALWRDSIAAMLWLGIGTGVCSAAIIEPADISGDWHGEGWGTIVLKQDGPGEYVGTYTDVDGKEPGTIRLTWAPKELHFNGTWSDGDGRSGMLSVRRDDQAIRGAATTDHASKFKPVTPRRGDVTWISGAPKAVAPIAQNAASPAQPLDLTAFYLVPASQFERGGIPGQTAPRGLHTLSNVPLDVGGWFCLWGAANARNGMEFPKHVRDIPVNRKFESLYVLHTSLYKSPDGDPIYRLKMHYVDGGVLEATMCYGVHMRDWYGSNSDRDSTVSDQKTKLVWRSKRSARDPKDSVMVRFFLTAIRNPQPSLEVKSISLASSEENCAGCILAMSTGPAELLSGGPDHNAAPDSPADPEKRP